MREKIKCFASYLSYLLEAGGEYRAELLPMIFNEYVVEEVSSDACLIVREGQGLSYKIIGKLNGGNLCCDGLNFNDETFLSDFGFLDGKMVS